MIETVIKQTEKLKAYEMPDALIVYNCSGGLLAFGSLISKEIEGIKNAWNVTMAGMFYNAELARATGANLEMHNLKTCQVAPKER